LKSRAIFQLDGEPPNLADHDPWSLGVELDDVVPVLAHEHMFA
jgi:hypothetical protein